MEYFLGGYMLLHCLPVKGLHPQLNGKPLLTCSTCFNESLLDDWSYQWLGFDRHAPYDANLTVSEHLAERFSIDDELWERIRIWSNEKYFSGHLGWPDIFVNSLIATEYKRLFFPQLENCHLLAMYFNRSDAQQFIRSWKPQNKMESAPGIHQRLSAWIPETYQPNEQHIGYDIVGLDIGGGFHTSHCHFLPDELHQRFGLTLNQHGLYNEIPDWQPVVDYMNDDTTGCEPVPWGIARIKQVIF